MLLNQILFIVYWWIVVNATLRVPQGSIDFIMVLQTSTKDVAIIMLFAAVGYAVSCM